MNLKSIGLLLLVAFALHACSSGDKGELIGVQDRPEWYTVELYGMNYIPAGSYTMGQSDQDVPFAHQSRARTVSIPAFYIDDTEITNNEYRQFVHWVRDHVILERLAEEDAETYKIKTYDDELEERDEDEWLVRWEALDDIDYEDGELNSYVLEAAYITNEKERDNRWVPSDYTPEEGFVKARQIDPRKLVYKYEWLDLQAAARKGRINGPIELTNDEYETNTEHRELKEDEVDKYTGEPTGRDLDKGYRNKKGQNNAIRWHKDRSRFIIQEEILVYPDTLVWVHDFTYSFNEPMTKMYFWHPAYDKYPVVGVTWQQANAFCVWRTNLLNDWRAKNQFAYLQDFRLPTEAEWEYAARGGLQESPFPWGGPYPRNGEGCFLGNFKPLRGRYMDDGGFYTVEADSYNPNDYGLYCMAGNVSEWTKTAFDESQYEYQHDLSPDYQYHALDHDPPALKRKVIRGGSWKDVGYYMQVGTRSYEYQDTAKSYIGFRCVMSYLGRGGREEGSNSPQ